MTVLTFKKKVFHDHKYDIAKTKFFFFTFLEGALCGSPRNLNYMVLAVLQQQYQCDLIAGNESSP